MVSSHTPASKIIGVNNVKGDSKISVGSWVMIVVILALLLLPLLTLTVAFFCSQKANAQGELYWYYWTQAAVQGAAKDQKSRVKVMLNNVGDQLISYYNKNKSLPRFDPDMDKFMTRSYKSVMNQDPDSGWSPSAAGSQRSFGSMRMFYDAAAGNLTKINDKYQLPEAWMGDANSIVVVTDGGSNAVAYYTGVDQKPMAFSVIDCTPGDDDDNDDANARPSKGSALNK